jgi:hypothetical protein
MGESLRIFRVIRPVAIAAALMLASCDQFQVSHDADDVDATPPATQNTPPPVTPPAQGAAPASVQGAYRVEVGGFCMGQGTGSVGSGSATLDAAVADDGGTAGSFHADLIIANGHFIGSGTVMGLSLACNGRLDPPDTSGPRASVLLKPRLVGTFTASDGRHGRFTGEYTASAPDPDHTSE